jgi:hypothetical protein
MADEERVQAVCPWCSAPLPSVDADECAACGARLVDAASEEIPGVTAVDPQLLRPPPPTRKPTLTLGSLFVGQGEEIPVPSEAEMAALARPDDEVRREMLRLEIEAGMVDLLAERRVMEAEGLPAAAGETPAAQPTPGHGPLGTASEPGAGPAGVAPAEPEPDRGA